MAGRVPGASGSALQTPRGTTAPNSARRRRPVVAEEDEEDMIRSLQIKNDDRYIAMNHYKEQSKNQSSDGHFARMLRASCIKPPPGQAAGERIRQPAVGNIDDRIEWQETFDNNVRRLLVDFQLSDVPSCRLQHLERMHNWFQEHGAKQTRKTQEGPCYLTADRSGAMPAGSTKDLPHNTSAATQLLSKTFRKS